MIVERAVDCGPVYRRKRHELLELIGALDDGQLVANVPATPAWSIRDVLAHVVGITADLNAGRFGDGDADAWTNAQVVSRSDHTIAELADEWNAESSTFEPGLRLLGYEIGSHYVADLLQHEQDIRHALGLPRSADIEALQISLDYYLDHFHNKLTTAQAGVLTVHVAGETWALGAGPTRVGITVDAFELFRATGGRRSVPQLRQLRWTGDPAPFISHMSAYPPPDADMIE